jgi:fatty acid-binding protein DegV
MSVVGDGTLKAMQKVRTKKKVLEALANKVVENTGNSAEYADKCYIGHSACEEDAKVLVSLIEEKVPALKDKVVMGDIGTVIGSHTGPGTLLVSFFGNERA